MKIFFESPTASIYYEEELDTLFLVYLGRVRNDQEFVEINTNVLNAFKTLHTTKFAVDLRKMGVISLASQKWVVDNLLPGMIKHLNGKRLLHAQLLDPSEIFSKVSASNIKNKSTVLESSFDLLQFSNIEKCGKP